MGTFVLVPGAWMGGWCWRQVTPRLLAAGQQVFTPTLTGLGERVHLGRPETNLDTHIQDIVNVLEFEDLHDVTLLGHSYGGYVVTGVAERVPERLKQVIYLDAVVPEGGSSLFEINGPLFRSIVEDAARETGDGSRWPIPPAEVLSQYISIDGMNDADLRWFYGKSTPHPIGTFKQPIELTNRPWQTIRRTYVFCTSERTDESWQAARDRTAAGWGYREMATGHWPMFSMPDQLADLLLDLVEVGAASASAGR
jgi:pimeloyl-ACP methyl ester carboxylesterase